MRADKIRRAVLQGAFGHFEEGFSLICDGELVPDANYEIVEQGPFAHIQIRVKQDGELPRYFTIKVTEHL